MMYRGHDSRIDENSPFGPDGIRSENIEKHKKIKENFIARYGLIAAAATTGILPAVGENPEIQGGAYFIGSVGTRRY